MFIRRPVLFLLLFVSVSCCAFHLHLYRSLSLGGINSIPRCIY